MSKDELMDRQLRAIVAKWGVETVLIRLAEITYEHEENAMKDDTATQVDREARREESFAIARALSSYQDEDYPYHGNK